MYETHRDNYTYIKIHKDNHYTILKSVHYNEKFNS